MRENVRYIGRFCCQRGRCIPILNVASSAPVKHVGRHTGRFRIEWVLLKLVTMMFVLVGVSSRTLASTDFWEKSPTRKRELYEDRKILVSVRDVEKSTEFKGAGVVLSSFEKTWKIATDPEKIRAHAKGLDKFEWDLAKGEALAELHILWKLIRIKAKTELLKDSKPPQIRFRFVDDSWMLLTGRLEFITVDPTRTLVVLRASTLEGQKAGWHWAMEGVLHRVAISLREVVEKDALKPSP